MSDSTPAGILTFMFTDIEGSTQLWEQYPEAMKAALACHDAILQTAVSSNHGSMVKSTGDGCYAAFVTATDAIAAALSAQQALLSDTWEWIQPHTLRVRIAIHTGTAERRAGDYFGPVLNRLARLMSVGHGGQVLISAATTELVREDLPDGARLLDLGNHRLKDLTRPEHVFQLLHPSLPSDFPLLKSLDAYPNNLPIQLTSFIGRQQEIAEIASLLSKSRLVSLTGPGGTGKTRLSQEVGAQLLSSYPHGVWFIELAPLSDPAQIIPTLAQVFGLHELPFNPLATLLVDYLREKKILLILDNCEHLIEACARLADDLLHQCLEVVILASSREALGITGEVVYRTPSLVSSESITLFVDRARLANPDFSLTDLNSSAITQICRRLDGIPLAIELAAARIRLLSPEQIAVRLDDRFRLLIGGSRTALPRQQTLRALIDWSYDLLSDEEKSLLQYASVFVGGWTLEALEAVSGDPYMLESLEQLVNKSMVVTEQRESTMRYSMLETIRQYAREKLFNAGQASAARDRHFTYYDELSEKMWHSFRTQRDFHSLQDQVFDEFENMRTAVEWGMEKYPETVLHLVANIALVASYTGSLVEGNEWLDIAINQFRALPPVAGEANAYRLSLLSKALLAQGMVGMSTGGVHYAYQAFDECISITRITGDIRLRGYALEMYFVAASYENVLGAVNYAEEGYEIFTRIDDSWGISMGLMNMARIAISRGDRDASQEYLELLKAKMSHAPISYMSGMTYLGLGNTEYRMGHYDIASGHFEEGLRIFKILRHKGFETILMSETGHIARLQGEPSRAKDIYRQTITQFKDLGNRPAVAHQLECFASIAMVEGHPQSAASLYGAAQALRDRIKSRMADHEIDEYEQSVAQLRRILPEAELTTHWEQGRSLTMEQAIQLALSF